MLRWTNGDGSSSQGQLAFRLLIRNEARERPKPLNVRFLPTRPLSLASPFGQRDERELRSSRALSTAVQETTTMRAGCSCSCPLSSMYTTLFARPSEVTSTLRAMHRLRSSIFPVSRASGTSAESVLDFAPVSQPKLPQNMQ